MTLTIHGLTFRALSPSHFRLEGYPYSLAYVEDYAGEMVWVLYSENSPEQYKRFNKRDEAASYLADKIYLALGEHG